MRVGSLFAGIGGFDLAARNVGWRTVWVSEIHPYASKVLAKHFPDAPNHGDITQIDFTRVEPVEVLCGGFPCQDISTAGKRAGITAPRSGLWSHYARAIGVLRPRYVVVENVAALLGCGLDRVLGDLAALGYDAEWHCIPASAVGAPHRRDRIWIVAYPNSDGFQSSGRANRGAEARTGELGTQSGAQPGAVSCGATLADAKRRDAQAGRERLGGIRPESEGRGVSGDAPGGGEAGRSSLADPLSQRGRGGDGEREDAEDVDASGEGIRSRGDEGWWAVEPDVGRVAHGIPSRVDRLTGLGNAIVPQVAEVLFRAIQAHEESLND